MSEPADQTPSLARVDSFPYRHRVAEVMRGPVIGVPPQTPLAEASRIMIRDRIGSLIVLGADGRAAGIATERDIIGALADRGGGAAQSPIAHVMSSPVASVPEDAWLFVAFGRMPRLGINHLLAIDADGRPVGMISASSLMRLRSTEALIIGDEIAGADDAAGLARAFGRLPLLTRALGAEGVEALVVTGAIAAIVRETTARAAELAQRGMADDGWGPPPAPWCVLVLGSGGRGESALAADQDNAIVYDDGHEGSSAADAWFAEAGQRIAEILSQAGLPKCKGGVMAANPEWRRSLAGWREEIGRWIGKKEGEALLNVDIFFDFAPVYGDRALAERLRTAALDAASRAPLFLRLLAAELETKGTALGPFGFFRTEQGRIDIKRGGFMPIVAAARVMALKHRVARTGTLDRLDALVAQGRLGAADAERMIRACKILLGLLLEQQIEDIAAGRAPSAWVEPGRLPALRRKALRESLRAGEAIGAIVQGPLSA